MDTKTEDKAGGGAMWAEGVGLAIEEDAVARREDTQGLECKLCKDWPLCWEGAEVAILELKEGVYKTSKGTEEATSGKWEGMGWAMDKDADIVEGKKANNSKREEGGKNLDSGLEYALLIKTL